MPKKRYESSFDFVPMSPVPADAYMSGELRAAQMRAPRSSETVLKTLGAVILAGSCMLGSAVIRDVQQGIVQGQELLEGAHSKSHTVYRLQEHEPGERVVGTFVFTGLGTRNPEKTADTLQAYRDIGSVYGIEYSDRDISIKELAHTVMEQARADDVEELVIDGYSAGGLIGASVAAYIHTHEKDVTVAAVLMNSSPFGEAGLTERSRSAAYRMTVITSLYPDSVYYERGRIATEVIARSDRYMRETPTSIPDGIVAHNSYALGGTLYTIDYTALGNEIRSVHEKMQDPDVASASLIQSQFAVIRDNRINESLAQLGKRSPLHPDTSEPVVIFTRSANAHDDTVVDVDASEQIFVRNAQEHNVQYLVSREPVGHANPVERPTEYNAAIRRNLLPYIALRQAAYRYEASGGIELAAHGQPTR